MKAYVVCMIGVGGLCLGWTLGPPSHGVIEDNRELKRPKQPMWVKEALLPPDLDREGCCPLDPKTWPEIAQGKDPWEVKP